MNWKTLPVLAVLACAACSDDPGGEERTPTDFSGDWLLTTTVVAKRLCDDNQPGNSRDEMLSIEQDGSSVTLLFDDYSASGSVEDGTLRASGSPVAGTTIQFRLMRDGDSLVGSSTTTRDDCSEERDALASRVVFDADFAGIWDFVLTVIGELCPDVNPTTDCFRIFQTGVDVLIVDPTRGNLTGTVVGNRATLVRENELSSVLLTLDILPSGDELTGTALETDLIQNCKNELRLDGNRRFTSCGSP